MHKKVINVSLTWHCSFLKRRLQKQIWQTTFKLVIFHFSTFFHLITPQNLSIEIFYKN